jgi:Fic family protein
MVRLAQRGKYFYLEHSYREGAKVKKRQEYLGTNVHDLEEKKRAFAETIRRERFPETKRNLPPSAEKIERERFAIRFTYDTQRIEGSTLTRKETADLLERGITPKERAVTDVKEAETHRAVFLKALEKPSITRTNVLAIHHALFKDTKPDIAGKVRQHQVAIARSKFLPPSPVEVEPLLSEFFMWYEQEKDRMHPVELAAQVHLKFVTIHPFADGNGRVSRILMNLVLHRRGQNLLNIPYEKRSGYYNALERSQVKNTDEPFITWVLKQYTKQKISV